MEKRKEIFARGFKGAYCGYNGLISGKIQITKYVNEGRNRVYEKETMQEIL